MRVPTGIFFVGLAVLTGDCLESQSTRCGWGGVCPPGKLCNEEFEACVGSENAVCSWGACEHPAQVCDEEHEQCIFPIQRRLCQDKADGDPCYFEGSTTYHRCAFGVCLEPYCGDGLIDEGERCDDANVAASDGCSSYCRLEAGWECFGEPSACGPAPTRFGPGATKFVTRSSVTLQDLYATPTGELLVVLSSPETYDVYRSADSGDSWTPNHLGTAVTNAGVFPISAELTGFSGTQPYVAPYDAHLRYSADAGLTFSPPGFVNVTNSDDLSGNKSWLQVIETPSGQYLAVFVSLGIYARVSNSLDGWSSTTRLPVFVEETRGGLTLASDGASLLLAAATPNQTFEVWSYDEAAGTFTLRSSTWTAETLSSIRLFHRESTNVWYLCGATSHSTNTDETVYVYRSYDGGATWGDEMVYLTGINRLAESRVACSMDETGIYVGYHDMTTTEVRVILPGAQVACGNDVLEPGELCDGDHLGGATCVKKGFGGGTLACTTDCQAMPTDNCEAANHPPSCRFVEFDIDRTYTIDPDGNDGNPPFDVYCADMDSTHPKEFLTLGLHDLTTNSSFRRYIAVDTEVTCVFDGVRFEDIYALRLIGTDRRFATCYGNGYYASVWGTAASCNPSVNGTMNVNLTETPFRIDMANGAGWTALHGTGRLTRNDGEGLIVEAEGTGYCGAFAPKNPPGLILAFSCTDCTKPECASDPVCLPETACEDTFDNDGDGQIDCNDPDCSSAAACAGMPAKLMSTPEEAPPRAALRRPRRGSESLAGRGEGVDQSGRR